MTRHDPKIYPHTKFRIPTSNYIQICSELNLARTETRGQGHARIQELSSGGVQVSLTKKKTDFFFLVLSLFYRSQMVNFKIPEGGPTFSRGGGPTFSRRGWVQLLTPYRKPYNL